METEFRFMSQDNVAGLNRRARVKDLQVRQEMRSSGTVSESTAQNGSCLPHCEICCLNPVEVLGRLPEKKQPDTAPSLGLMQISDLQG